MSVSYRQKKKLPDPTGMLISEILLFGFSGFVGFLVDASILSLLLDSLGPYLSRGLSFLAAVFTTWLINRSLTFRSRRSEHIPPIEFLVYLGSMMAGGSINLGLYALLLENLPLANAHPTIGVALGSLAGMSVNFILSRTLIFDKKREGS